ncbi:unnamed protein product [Rotaria socialis]
MKSMISHDTLSVPRDFICPITREIMQNPVLLVEDGHSYEFDAIERWLTDNNTSPMTNKTLNDRRFVNNFNLKSAIEEYCAQQNTILSSNQFLTFNIRYSRMPNTWKNKPTLNIRLSLLGSSNAVTVAADISFFYLDQLYEDKYVVIIQLSDIPGMERYESCCDNHFRHCHGALIVTDSTDIDTLQRAELYWYKQLQLKGQDHVESMLVCNKKRAENFASLHQMPIHHVSALQGDNISSIFKQLILRILQNELLLDQIKESSSLDERSSIKLKRMRRAPATQVSLQSSTTEDGCDRNSSRRCC